MEKVSWHGSLVLESSHPFLLGGQESGAESPARAGAGLRPSLGPPGFPVRPYTDGLLSYL